MNPQDQQDPQINSQAQPGTQPVAQPSPATGVANPTVASESSRKNLYIALGVLGALLAIGLLFFALSGNKDADDNQATNSLPKASEPATKEEAKPAESTGEEIMLNKTITDPEMGYTIEAVSMSIGKVAIPAKFADAQSGKTAVAITYKITDSGKFSGSGKNTLLRLTDSKGTTNSSKTSISKTELEAAGYKSMEDATENNNVVEGTHVYWVDTTSTDKLTLVYKRLAASVVGSTETIPTKEFTLELK